MAIFLSESDVVRLLPMERAIESVEQGLRLLALGEAQSQSRQRVQVEQTSLNVMSAAIPSLGILGSKSYSSHPANGPTAFFLLFQTDGALLAVMEADELGRIRTGATTGVATKHMAPRDASVGALIGVGFQAETQLRAVCAVRPLREVRVWGRRPEAVAEFCARLQPSVTAQLVPTASAKAAVRGAHIVTTITSAEEPVISGDWLAPGTHVNAAGNNRSYEREIDSAAVARASRIVTDSASQAQIESGDLVLAAADGIAVWDRVVELGAVVAGHAPGRGGTDEITLFKSNGIALEDVAAAHFVYQEALRQGAGVKLPF